MSKLPMRALIMLVAWLATMTSARAATATEAVVNTPVKDKWALVVGISKFANPDFNLRYPAKDATDFRNFLVEKCNFAADHVRLMTDEQATAANILDSLGDSWLPRVAGAEDLVVIFISSHGSPSNMDVANVNYVVAHDTNPDKLFTTGIPLVHLCDTIKERIRSKRVLIVLDACHSGGIAGTKDLTRKGNVSAAQIAQGTGQMVICSSAADQVSWESSNYANSIFTHTLIEGLQKNGMQTKLADALTYVKEEVPREVQQQRAAVQTPVIVSSTWKGNELALAAVPAAPRPAPNLPPLAAPASLPPAPPPVVSSVPSKTIAPAAIPDCAGDWLGTNGVVYHIWQNGRNTGWDMPDVGEYGRGTISEDGKTSAGYWFGPVTGKGTSVLESDDAGKVIKMTSDDGTVFTRVEKGKRVKQFWEK